MKQVLDPEAPPSLFKIDTAARQAVPPKGTPPVMSPFDENALEAALKIKDAQPAGITVISLGKKLARAVVRSSLAAGADRLVLLEDECFGDFNTFLTAHALAAAVKKLGRFDLILCGIQAADTNAGQVGIGIAGGLGIPCITFARKVELPGDQLRVEQALTDGYQVIETATPAVVTVSYEVGALRRPGVADFMAAGKKPVTVWGAKELGIGPGENGTGVLKMYQPVRDARCELIAGTSPEEQAAKLAERLKETKAI